MTRPLRLFMPGYWYHLYTRGQRNQPLFFSDGDKVKFLEYYDNAFTRMGGAIGSFCLMTNHAHLIVQQSSVPLNKVYQKAHTGYSKYFNEKRKTAGYVFQGRPGCKAVLNDSYLIQLVDYIHKNPVKSGIVDKIKNYKWSSWYWFSDKKCDWINLKSWKYPPGISKEVLKDEDDDSFVKGGYKLQQGRLYIGTAEEWRGMQRRDPVHRDRKLRERRGFRSMADIAGRIISDTGYTIDDLKSRSKKREVSELRQKAMAAIYKEGYGVTETGKYFSRTPVVVSRAYEKWKKSKSIKV